MENFLNQMRVPFTGAEENKPGLGGTRDSKIPIQKTQSFKVSGEKKQVGQNWFQKQFARKRSGDHESRDMDHAAAVAAAAFAINLLEVSEEKSDTPKASLEKTKSKVDGTKPSRSLLSSASKRLSGSFRSKDDQGKKTVEAISLAPSVKKTSTFSDEKPETSTKPDLGRRQTLGESFERHIKADEWEGTKLQEIRQRYDKLREMIDSWENKKKMKARRKLDKEQRGVQQRMMRALDDFEYKNRCIDQIADGARTKAEESRRNEEQKAKEKANVIRSTGKTPGICFCF
ncbi:unnamed protein product [Sphenostylis stenocarpa]|uniref:Remorin C-terminal domain-containing protein n=1 Tax=Sphenostylis stenocarpa TaxID=92480 RepID=A0AA86RVI4_9FABA|nr:unnamed protein product [Sphenostylis stenocarpa]